MTTSVSSTRLAALVCAAAILGFVLLARSAGDAPSTSDAAVIESYTRLASEGALTVGAYSRFQWHHPGPLYFYLLAPFYLASGERPAGLNAGAATLSLVSLALAATILLRRRSLVSLSVLGVLVLLAFRSTEAMVSPWNPHVPVMPVAALLVVAADVVAGNAWMLPVAAFLASLSAQAHIALVPCAFAIGMLAVARALAGSGEPDGAGWRAALAATVVVLVGVWAVPVYEELTATPRGNLTELWQFFAGQHRSGQPLGVATSAWSDMLVGPFRRDYYVAHGWALAQSRAQRPEAISAIAMAATLILSGRAFRAGNRFEPALGSLAFVAAAVSLWSVTRIEERIFDHDVFWIAGVGAVLLGSALGLVFSALGVERRIPRRVHGVAFVLLMAVVIGANFRSLQAVARASYAPPAEATIARAIADDLQAYLDSNQIRRPLIRLDQEAWDVGAGVILDLQKRGRSVAVEEDWVVMFTPACRPRAGDDAVLAVAAPAEHVRLVDRGAPVVSAHEPVFVHAVPPPIR